MKRIELVLNERAFRLFQHLAPELGVSEFDVAEVRRSSNHQIERARLYRGQPFSVDLVSRNKVEFVLSGQQWEQAMAVIANAIHPDSVAIFELERISPVPSGNGVPSGASVVSRRGRSNSDFDTQRPI